MGADRNENLSGQQSGDIDFVRYWKVVRRYWRSIVAIVITVSICAVIISLILPKKYKAEALIIPVSAAKGGGGVGGLLSQFSGLASLAGVSFGGGGDESEKFLAILKSRTLTEDVIKQLDLMPILFPKSYDENGQNKSDIKGGEEPDMERAVKQLKKHITITENKKDKTIRLAGIFRDPEMSARVVNGYIDALQSFINDNAFTVAKRNRIFIEDQLEQNKREFLEAGKEVNEFYKKNRVSAVEGDLDVDIDIMIDSLVEDMNSDSARSPKLAQLGPSSLDKLETKITGLRMRKKDIEAKIEESKLVKDVPQQVYLAYLMMRRELLAKMNALLTTQYEMSKIEETREDLGFQVIDWAAVPIRRDSPSRAKICIVSFFMAFMLAVGFAFFREHAERTNLMNRLKS